jgi:hypothetical protein
MMPVLVGKYMIIDGRIIPSEAYKGSRQKEDSLSSMWLINCWPWTKLTIQLLEEEIKSL